MTIGSTIYSCTFFNTHASFPITRNCQPDLPYSLLHPEIFSLLKSPCVSILRTVFSTQACSGKIMFSQFVNIFWLKPVSLFTYTFFCKFHMVCTSSATKYLMTDLCSILGHSDLLPFWMVWKQMFFVINQFQTTQILHLWRKKILNIYIYIYINKEKERGSFQKLNSASSLTHLLRLNPEKGSFPAKEKIMTVHSENLSQFQ